MANWNSSKLDSPTGATLHLYSAKASKSPKAVIQINHGMGEHADRYQRFAEFATGRGYHVYAHDHRGHGQTTGDGSALGRFAETGGWDKVIADVGAVNSHIRENHADIPIVCFGHSMGSIIAFNYALRNPDSIDALACWNAGYNSGGLARLGKAILKVERLFKGGDKPSGITRALTFDAWNKQFKPNRTEFDWLSRDEAEVDKYVADPLCGIPIAISLWQDVISGIGYADTDANLSALPKDLPIHLQAGSDDPSTEKGSEVKRTEGRLLKAGLGKVTFNMLNGARHESLNEINRDDVSTDFVDWLDTNVQR